MKLENVNLTGQFLISMPAMIDTYFSKTVTFICTHNQDGAMGIVINRPTDITIANLFVQIQLSSKASSLLEKNCAFWRPGAN